MLKQLVSVGSKHIRHGKCGDQNRCAIALALEEQVGANPSVIGDIRISVAGKRMISPLSTRACRFISKFDNNKRSVKPFKFWFVGKEA